MSALSAPVLALAAAYGVHLLTSGLALGWSGVGPGPRRPRTRRHERWLRSALARAGLGEVRGRDLLAGALGLGSVGTAVGAVVFGPSPAALAAGVTALALPAAGARERERARRAAAQDAWPRMIEEIRVQVGALGRSVPQALLDVGARGPVALRPDFAAARREWQVSTDFGRTGAVLKRRLADPTADATIETLLVAHEIGGTDLDARLRRLAEDRVLDVQSRKDARAALAGARFSRLFVLLVPLGMAGAGMSLGDGSAAYRTPGGQAAVLVGLSLVGGCWIWAGALMRLPAPPRVFER